MRSTRWRSRAGGRSSTSSRAASGPSAISSTSSVSKHLRVLREVGAVDVRDEGRRRLYRLNGRALKPIHDWVSAYEATWSERFEQLNVVLAELEKEEGDGLDGQ
jgi:DNA-binding transcriptional ArsR family regulator